MNTRLPLREGINAWELKQGDVALQCRIDGPLIFNSVYAAMDAAMAGYGLAYVPELLVRKRGRCLTTTICTGEWRIG